MRNTPTSFQSFPKTYTRDQDKARTPEQTIENFYQRLEMFDIKILSEVKRIDNGRLDIPVYFSVCTEEAQALPGTKKQMAKGASSIQSKAAACMKWPDLFFFFSFKANEENFIR